MISRFLKLRTALSLGLAKNDSINNISSNERHKVASVTDALKCIDEATTKARTESILSLVIRLIHCITSPLSNKGPRRRHNGPCCKPPSQHEDKVSRHHYDGSLALTMLADPRFKSVCSITQIGKQWAA